MYRALRLCSHGGGFEAIPESPHPLDLGAIRSALESAGVPVIDARVMLIASMDPEVTISRSGRLLFKTDDARVAGTAFRRLAALTGLDPRGAAGARRPTG